MALAALVACTAFLGGCSGDDDSGGGGGGSKIKAPPTARPNLSGMSARIDVSGGNATAGNTTGGNGGDIFLSVSNGRFVPGAAAAPGVNTNFLAPTLAVDSTVTFAELSAISAGNFFLDTTIDTAFINLFGFDFHLPSGATLDLSDAVVGTVDTVVIRTHGTGDVIRIDGTVLLGRAGADSVDLTLQTGPASGIAVSINGSINGDGAAGFSPSSIEVITGLGAASLGGSISSRSVAASTPVNGGVVNLAVGTGNLHIASGMFVSNGGDGFGTGNGGSGGDAQAIAGSNSGVQRFPWGMRANGGTSSGGTGGNGGGIRIGLNDVADLFVPFELNGGSGSNANGGNGGSFVAIGSLLKGVAAGTLNGGDGSGLGAFNGGNGGVAELMGTAGLQSFALDVIANGGFGTSLGGNGGGVLIPATSLMLPFPVQGPIDQVLVDLMAQGGASNAVGGNGGGMEFIVMDHAANLTLRADIVGGDSSGGTGTGGDGGGVFLANATGGLKISDVVIDLIAHGGDALIGSQGGDGGGVNVQSGYAIPLGSLDVSIEGAANGGQAVSFGGEGGGAIVIAISFQPSVVELDFTANGGRATGGVGGDGGELQIVTPSDGAVEVTGEFTGQGGSSGGAGNVGGEGGSLEIQASGFPVRLTDLTVDLTGGASDQADGGEGGTVDVQLEAMLVINGGEYITNGGAGSTVSGTGIGGEGGAQLWATDNFDIIVTGATFRANGGNGAGGGGNGADSGDYGIEFTPDLDDDGPGAYCLVNATVEANGGNALVSGNGGGGGSAAIDNYDNNTDFSYAGVSEARGTWIANGGTGITMGGSGGFLDIDSNGDAVIVNATMRANGGAGATGGSGGIIYLYADDDGATGFATVSAAGTLQANGGTGTATGGDGGTVQIYGTDATITISATVEANGGAGPVGGNGGVMTLGDSSGNQAQSLTITSSARIRANGGASNGNGGTITLDPQGTGGLANPNYTEQAGSVIEANANGTGTAGTITRD